jgi:adenylate cyclase
LEGYTLLLGAIAMMHRTDYHDFDKARQMLEHLIERSQRHPVPHAWLAKWHVLKVQQGWANDVVAESRLARSRISEALNLDSQNALAWTIDGQVKTHLFKQLDLAEDSYETAIECNPNESLAWLLKGTLHAFKGDGEIAVSSTSRAVSLSPLDPMRYFYDSLAATAYNSNRNYEHAAKLAKQSIRANRMHTSSWRTLTVAYVGLGQLSAAKDAVQTLLKLEPDLTVTNFLNRSPSAEYWTGTEWAKALECAGLPR